MPLDAVSLYAFYNELIKYEGMKIEKIHMPNKEEVVLNFRASVRLFISCASSPYVYLSNSPSENPLSPPMFCMLLRKHIQGGIIDSIECPLNERMLKFNIISRDDMGDKTKRVLIVELIPQRANIVLTDGEGRIIEALRRVEGDVVLNKRATLPGMFYIPPESQNKKSIYDTFDVAPDLDRMKGKYRDFLMDNFAGMSPLVTRELAFISTGDTETYYPQKRDEFVKAVNTAFEKIRAGEFSPCMLKQGDGAVDICFMEISQYLDAYGIERFKNFSSLFEAFYKDKKDKSQLAGKIREISRPVDTAISRMEKRLGKQEIELNQAKNRETLKICADTLMANVHLDLKGKDSVELINYYDENLAPISIKLDVKLDVLGNASKYYKEYAKAKNAERYVAAEIEKGERELAYLYSVKEAISRVLSVDEAYEIKEELIKNGYIKGKGEKKRKTAALPMYEFTSPTGVTVLAGRNNIQNEELTFKIAGKFMTWAHVKDKPGSHVVIMQEKPDDVTLDYAVKIAAALSEKQGDVVRVDYTLVKNVKKIPAAKTGMVTYSTYNTATVTVDKEILKSKD